MSVNFFKRPQLIGSMMLSLVLCACGGGNGGNNTSSENSVSNTGPETSAGETVPTEIKQGRFLDAAVSNVRYITLTPDGKVSMSGFTAEDGSFFYRDGENVSFYIGDILLGHAAAKDIVTPVSLVENAANSDALANMLRFLQTLDEDASPSNGIQITDAVHQSARAMQVDFDEAKSSFEVQSALTNLLAVATNSPTMPTVVDALTHFRETLLNAYDTNSADTVLDLVNTRWQSTFTADECGDTTATLLHTFNTLGHFTNGYHDLTMRNDGSCRGSSLGVFMALYENDKMFSCANGCTLQDLNRTVYVDLPEPHTATLVYEPGTNQITIVHEFEDGRQVTETMKKL